MIDRRIAVAFSMIYAAVCAGLLIVNLITAFIVVAVIGGPITSILYRLSRRPRAEK